MNDPQAISHAKTDAARARLFRRFADLAIDAPTVPYPAHETVEEGQARRGAMAGVFTKNLLLRDKKARLFLFSVHEDRNLNLKVLHTMVGARGQFSFASAEKMVNTLGVAPGALTPLALINDPAGLVTFVIDSTLLQADQVNFHPLINTESTGLRPAELLTFIRSCERTPIVLQLDEERKDTP